MFRSIIEVSRDLMQWRRREGVKHTEKRQLTQKGIDSILSSAHNPLSNNHSVRETKTTGIFCFSLNHINVSSTQFSTCLRSEADVLHQITAVELQPSSSARAYREHCQHHPVNPNPS